MRVDLHGQPLLQGLKAISAGEQTITLAFMHAHRPASMPFARPQR